MSIQTIPTSVAGGKRIFGTSLIDGTMSEVTTDGSGNLNVNIQAGGSAGNNAAAGPTGQAVPLDADYVGVNIGGTLIGVTGFSLTNSKAAAIAVVDGSGNQITSFGGGTQFADNAASGATPTGTLSMGWDSSLSKVRALKVDTSQNLNVNVSAITNVPIFGTATSNASAAVWNSGTAGNTVLNVTSGSTLYNTVIVAFNQTSTITGGAATFEGSVDGSNWLALQGVNSSGTSGAGSTYTFQQSTYASFQFNITGLTFFRVRLSTTISGTGSVTVEYTVNSLVNPTLVVANVGNFPATQNVSGSVSITGTPTVSVTNFANPLPVSQSGNWSTRTQDGAGTAITSTGSALDVNLKTSSITLPVSGTVTANQGGAPWSVDVTDRSARLLGHVNVDNFPATQPVSGTVTANQGTNPWVVSAPSTNQSPIVVPQVVQVKNAVTSVTATSLQVVLNPTVAGNGLIVFAFTSSGTTAPTVSDSQGNVYTTMLNSGTAPAAGMFTATAGSGANTVTINAGGSAVSIGVVVYEISGVPTTEFWDFWWDFIGASGSSMSFGTATALYANELVLFAVGLESSATVTDFKPNNLGSGTSNPEGVTDTNNVAIPSGTLTTLWSGHGWVPTAGKFDTVATFSASVLGSGFWIAIRPVQQTVTNLMCALQDAGGTNTAFQQHGVYPLTVDSNLALDVNLKDVAGAALVTGTGASGAGIPRVTVSNDSAVNQTAGTAGFEKITDGTNTVTVRNATPGIFDYGLTVVLSPNSAALPTGGNVIGSVKITDTTNNVQATVKGASTAAVAADTSLVVTLSPNSPLPAGTGTTGSAVPTTATLIAGFNGANLRSIQADVVGGMRVSEQGGIGEILQSMLLEMRATKAAIIALGYPTLLPEDFSPGQFQDIYVTSLQG
jgi:hypothetical protein